MIGIMIRTTLTVAVASMQSEWYIVVGNTTLQEYSDEEDRINPGLVTEVKVVESKKTKSRGGRK